MQQYIIQIHNFYHKSPRDSYQLYSFLHNREVQHLLKTFVCLSFVPEAVVAEESPDILNGLQ
jgi:hypothetical protein